MRDMKITIGLPYRGSSDAAKIDDYQVTFEGKFDQQIRALKFMHELNELCAKYIEGKETE